MSESADVADADEGDADAGNDGAYTLDSVRTTAGRDLLVDLVSTYSPSGEEEPAAGHLVEFFEAHDREVFLDDVGNVRAPADDGVLLTSHVDTVPGEIPVRVADGDEELGAEGPVLWGRGSVDATGSLAAMAHAAVQTDVSFVGVVGEEVDSRGALHLVADRDAPEAVVNGEPSGWDAVTLGYRGLVSGTYSVATESAHGARPEADAIDHATDWWTTVRETVERHGGEGFEAITPRALSIDGGLADDGESVEAEMAVRFRVPPTESTESVQGLVDATIGEGDIEWHSATPPHVGSARSAVATAFRGAIRRAGGTPRHLHKTGTADANHYAEAWDVPVATYGPGDASLDHTPTERLPLTEFDRATDVLCAVCERLTE